MQSRTAPVTSKRLSGMPVANSSHVVLEADCMQMHVR